MAEPLPPVANPPPWNQTMTGRLLPSPSAGVQTLRERQSSPSAVLMRGPSPGLNTSAVMGRRPSAATVVVPLFWTHSVPHSTASRTPFHGAGFFGGMKRPAPAVDAP